MIYSKKSSRTPDQVEQRLREAAQRHKFGVLNVLDIKQTLHNKGFELQQQCRVIDVCNPQAAATILNRDMSASAMLPCRISVYSGPDGCTISTVRPPDLVKAAGLKGADELAGTIDREIVAIIDESA